MKKIHVLHGPSLNLLGIREPMMYGLKTLSILNEELETQARLAGFKLTAMQSNSESDIIDSIHQSLTDDIDYMILNPAAYTHTSIAIRDAILAVKIPFIEVHISNINQRESFRKQSYFSDIALGVITGFGTSSYQLAIQAINFIEKRE